MMASDAYPAAGTSIEPRARRLALGALSMSMLLSSLGTSIANVALPTLAEAFTATFQQIQWVVLAYLLAITTLIVSVGRLGDLAGRRRLLLGGLVLFTAASMVCGLSPSLSLLIVARAAQGVGAAVMLALSMALVGETVAKEKTGSAMGLLGTMSAVGTALGPSLGGMLIAAFGWRAIFLVNAPLGLAALLLASRYLPLDQGRAPSARRSFDAIGTLLLALTLAAYALAMTIGRGHFGAVNVALLLAAALGVAMFVLAETRVASPLLQPGTFRDRALSAGCAMSGLVATVMMTTLVVGPFYLARALGLDAALTGLTLSAGPIVAALGGVPAGRVVDRLGAQRMTIAGLVAMAAGAALLSIMPAAFGVPAYVAAIVVLTVGYALFQAANNTAVMMGVPADRRGVVSGVLNLSRSLGLITGASAMGAVFAIASGASDLATAGPAAVAAGMHVAFGVAAALLAAAIAVALTGASRKTKMPGTGPGI